MALKPDVLIETQGWSLFDEGTVRSRDCFGMIEFRFLLNLVVREMGKDNNFGVQLD